MTEANRDERPTLSVGPLSSDEGTAPPPDALLGQSIRYYLVERELGRGGMGIVYRGYDTRLERHVAVKILPASDPVRLARFRREAKLLAAMNHANVATIHGLEQLADGRYAIIMELIEGETLAARLDRGPLPLKDALEICGQIAGALAQAHACGVVHRDLKPGNAMLGPDGVVKVLDFGLARRVASLKEAKEAPTAPTTEEALYGMDTWRFAGTPGYMSPEQIRGEPNDHRTDIFAFGCILFECITGCPAFRGANQTERITRTLGGNLDWSVWPSDVPYSVRELVTRCVESDRERRLADLRQARESLRSVRGSPVGAPAVEVSGLGQASTSFIGRSSEIAELGDTIRRARLVTLTGLGGSGKTRLAQELSLRTVTSFPDGATFVDLAPVQDPAHVSLAVLTALGLRAQPGRSGTEVLIDHLREKNQLLVLDNCEHLLDASRDLCTSLLRASPAMRILATSRQSIGVPGEQEYPVRPLNLPQEDRPRLEHARDNEAVRLFLERAQLVRPGFDITQENCATIIDICRRVDGIPLGIELAAALVKVLAPGQISARLQSDLKVLAAGRPSSARYTALDAAIRWSYDQLAEPQRRTLRAASIFVGGWTLEAMESVAGQSPDTFDILDDLSQLVSKSLVVVEPDQAGGFRYRMLETIRQFAREELRAAGEEALVQARHVDYFLKWAHEMEVRIGGAEQVDALRSLDADRDNMLAAARYCEALPDGTEKALRLLAGLDRYWIRRGHLQLGGTALHRALEMPGAERHTIDRARALYALASIAIYGGIDDDPRALFQESLDLARTLGEKQVAAWALNGLGIHYIDVADYESAKARLEECITVGMELGDLHIANRASNNLAVVAFSENDFGRARTLFEKIVENGSNLKDVGGVLMGLTGVSRSSLFMGDVVRAREALRATVPLIETLGDKRQGATGLLTAGLLALKVDEPGTAAKLLAAGEALRATYARPPLYAPADQKMRDETVSTIREALGQSGLDRAWAEGSALDFHRSLRAVLEFADPEASAET